MSYLQTNIGDLKNELKKLQETTNAQIERLQNLLEKTSSSTFNKLSYADQYYYKKELADTGQFYILGLLVDDSENNGKEFIKEYELNYQNILKQENVEMILTKFSWNGIPTTLLLDKNYKVLKSYSGPITYDPISAYSG